MSLHKSVKLGPKSAKFWMRGTDWNRIAGRLHLDRARFTAGVRRGDRGEGRQRRRTSYPSRRRWRDGRQTLASLRRLRAAQRQWMAAPQQAVLWCKHFSFMRGVLLRKNPSRSNGWPPREGSKRCTRPRSKAWRTWFRWGTYTKLEFFEIFSSDIMKTSFM